MKRSFAITGFAVLMLCVFSSSSLANQKKPRTLVAGIFDKLMNKDGRHDTALPAKECQGAINQFFSSLLPPPYATVAQNGFIVAPSTLFYAGTKRRENHYCWMMTEDCFYPQKKFPVDHFSNVATACGIDRSHDWKGKTHNRRCSEQLQSLKRSVNRLIAATEVTKHYPPSHPIWAETEELCKNHGLCEFQLMSARDEVMKSYLKIKAACNMG